MTGLHLIEAVVDIWVNYWPLFFSIAVLSLLLGIGTARQQRAREQCRREGHQWAVESELTGNLECRRCGKLVT